MALFIALRLGTQTGRKLLLCEVSEINCPLILNIGHRALKTRKFWEHQTRIRNRIGAKLLMGAGKINIQGRKRPKSVQKVLVWGISGLEGQPALGQPRGYLAH